MARSALSPAAAPIPADRIGRRVPLAPDRVSGAKSRVLQIEFVSDPARRPRRRWMRRSSRGQERRKPTPQSGGAWLAKRIDELRVKVADSDGKVQTVSRPRRPHRRRRRPDHARPAARRHRRAARDRARRPMAASPRPICCARCCAGQLDEVQDSPKDDRCDGSSTRVTLEGGSPRRRAPCCPSIRAWKELSGNPTRRPDPPRRGDGGARLESDARLAGAEVER